MMATGFVLAVAGLFIRDLWDLGEVASVMQHPRIQLLSQLLLFIGCVLLVGGIATLLWKFAP